MGLRGAGSVSLSRRRASLVLDPEGDKKLPWNKPGLSRAERVIEFCQALTVTSGSLANKNLQLRPWQRRFIERIYATDRHGVRQVRTAILSMGRKNGKTQLAAALALCHLSGPEQEPRGEVYSCANDRFQASKIFNEMVALIINHPWLLMRVNVQRFKKEIEDLTNGSVYAALSAEAKTKMGLSPSCVIYDELGQASGRALYDAMDSALGARKEPLLLVISTQAANDVAPMSLLIDYGEKINRGEIRDRAFHLTLYSAPMEADPWDRKTWKQANPALNDFRSLSDVERLASQAQRMPAQENAFRNLILNQRVAAESRFIEPRAWKACGDPPSIPEGARVFAGLDLSSTRDLSALVVVWKDASEVFHVRPYCWLPGDPIARGDKDAAPYAAWIKSGQLYGIGDATDPRVIARKIAELNGRNRIEGLAFDRWRVAEVRRELDQIGVTIPLIEHGQGFKDMNPAVNLLDKLIAERKIRHGNHPVLAFCAANVVVTRDPAGNLKFDKAKSTGRIDAIVALAMAISAADLKGEKPIDIEALIATIAAIALPAATLIGGLLSSFGPMTI
jgi:phage terminase large subunit-like protein